VRFNVHPPPTSPVKTTPAELEQFTRDLHHRASRFPDDANAFAHWQRTHQQKLAALLMGGGPPEPVALNAEETARENHPEFALLSLRYRSLPDRVNTALLSLPNATPAARKHPLLLALHGHESTWGAADPAAFTPGHADDFCAYFAQRGWAVLHPATMDHTRQHERWTLQGEWTHDALRALDLALARPDIDPARVAVVGLSTGAHLAMNVLALDPRVRTGVVGCVLSTWHHEATRMRVPPHCDCGVHSQLAPHLEQCDWAALAAPRPVQFQHGRLDQSFFPGADDAGLDLNWNTGTMPRAEYDAMFAEVERAWRAAGRPDAVETMLHEGRHQVDNAAAFAWVTRWTR
jgi:dienelactone hydrolase